MANAYITIAPSNDTGTAAKRFRVVEGGWKRQIQRNQQIEYAISGKPDVTEGGLVTTQSYTIRVRYQAEASGFGTRADLEALFRLNNPTGTPSNLLRLSDHHHSYAHYDSSTYADAIIIEGYNEEPLSTIIDGDYAWFFVSLTFILMREV